MGQGVPQILPVKPDTVGKLNGAKNFALEPLLLQSACETVAVTAGSSGCEDGPRAVPGLTGKRGSLLGF